MFLKLVEIQFSVFNLFSNYCCYQLINLAWSITQLELTKLYSTARIIHVNVSLLAYVYVSILCLVYVLPFKIQLSTKVCCKHASHVSSDKKIELMLTGRAKAYSSSCSQTVSLSPAISSRLLRGHRSLMPSYAGFLESRWTVEIYVQC